MTFEKVAQILSKHKNIGIELIKEDSSFSGLGFDSLDVVELIMQFEEEFGVDLSATSDLKTVGDFVRIIDEGLKNDKDQNK